MDGEELRRAAQTRAGEKPFEWQLCVDRQWLPLDNDHVIESHYCHPGAKGISINTTQGQVHIDFDKLETQSEAVTVRRLSFTPQGSANDVGWYFRDDQRWREYGSQTSGTLTSSVSSKEVERQFILNPEGSLTFRVGSVVYTLNMSTMSQRNCATGMCRNVRRRPKFPSNAVNVYSSSQLTDGGYKWEFMGDEGKWTEYQAHVCSFDSAAIEGQYQLNPKGQLNFRIRSYSYTLDFSRMDQVNDVIGTRRAVRRTGGYGSLQTNSSSTLPQWQFQDIDGLWKDYSKENNQCSLSNQDIELQYQQNPSGTITFKTRNFSYELNFSAMTQRNLSTNTSRSVRRLNP